MFDTKRDLEYILSAFGQDIAISNQPAKAVILHKDTALSNEKFIITMSEIKQGDVIKYQDNTYLVLNEVSKHYDAYYKAYMRKTNCTLKFAFDGVVYEFPAIFEYEKDLLKQDSAGLVVVNTTEIHCRVIVPKNENSLKISIDKRFIKFGSAWRIYSIELDKEGLITMYAKQDMIDTSKDDVVNEIADYIAPNPSIEKQIIIDGADYLIIGQTATYTATYYENNVAKDVVITFSVDDASKLQITGTTNNSCTVQALAKGVVVLTASYGDVSATKEISISGWF